MRTDPRSDFREARQLQQATEHGAKGVQHARVITCVKRGHFSWLKHTEAFFKYVLWAFMGVFFGARRNDAVCS